MTEAEGFIIELALAVGFNPSADCSEYICTEAQLLEFAKKVHEAGTRAALKMKSVPISNDDPLIEYGVPIQKGGRMAVLSTMKPGDSVLFTSGNGESIRSDVSREKKRIGGTYRTKQGRDGVRVWKIA